MKRVLRTIPAAALVWATLASPVEAQRAVWVAEPEGYLGVRGEIEVVSQGRVHRAVYHIEGTEAGSPAREAGLTRGDRIVGIGGERLTLERLSAFFRDLRPGDEIRFTLERDGKQREVLLEADRRTNSRRFPSRLRMSSDWTEAVESLQAKVARAFDETRTRLEEEPEFVTVLLESDSTLQSTLRIVQNQRRGYAYSFSAGSGRGRGSWVISTPETDASEIFVQGSGPRIRVRDDERTSDQSPSAVLAPAVPEVGITATIEPEVVAELEVEPLMGLPVDFLRMESAEAEALKKSYVVLTREMARILEARHSREAELAEEMARRAREVQLQDEVLTDLEGENRRIVREIADVERRFREMQVTRARTDAPAPVHEEIDRLVGGNSRSVLTDAVAGLSSSAPRASRGVGTTVARLVGQHYVGGAQMMSMNDNLASYFEVEEGVLVLDVLEGTPASEAGLRAGDVIVRAGRIAITDVEGLRRALSEGRSGVRLRVVREGEMRTVRFGG